MTTPFRQGLNKVYLPNIIFKMVRAPNLQPNQVAFRVPPKCNKFDIHSYLTNIYGVNVQEVRTMNYGTVHKKGRNGKTEVVQSAYKKAIVTLDSEFVYPPEPEWCELDNEQQRLGTKAAGRKLKGWRFRGTPTERADLKQVNDQLQARMEAEQKSK
ncbi:ribosomal protein L23-domain-containing protein [Halteromyces radiatus]|uniref:ribosomal protein L23-domain-containing protein n=1 Tax=Halteromyces radiatus TaxID=101107 RepID=UPI00221F63F2|nr:ribosomal protein L23-domain-containing protein [Halteromyces radiatus]KAI8079948.1 ribosomal protein L23-domain-containing protein [Halteromyces radiatus]